MIKAVLFDVDGTLVSLDVVVEAINHTCRDWNLRELTKGEIYEKVIGLPLKDSLKEFFPFTKQQAIQFSEDYHENYKKYHVAHLLPNAKQVLQTLKDKKIKVGIVTTKSKATGLKTIKDLNIPHDVLITQDDVKKVKPHPEPINKALEKLKVQPAEAMMVGDHLYDIESANKAGCISIAIDTGARTKEQLMKSKPNYLIHELKEILEIIK